MSDDTVQKSKDKAANAPHPEDARKPDSPTDVTKPSWKYILKRGMSEFSKDKVTDLAASLTYYAVLSVFPALLALVSLLGVFGQGEQTANAINGWISQFAPDDVQNLLGPTIEKLTTETGAGVALAVGIAGALWTASGYTGAFGRAMNRIHEVEEGRPFWKLKPAMLLLTLLMLLIVATIIFALALSGDIAEEAGNLIGLGGTAVTVWSVAKWPVVILLAILLIAMLYYFTPNVEQPKFRWISVGSLVALVISAIAVAAFIFYLSNFASYNATYGVIGSVISLLLGIWIVNNVLLLGAEIDAEVERGRELQGGIKAEESVQLPLRDTRQVEKQEKKQDALVERGREIREMHEDQDYDGRSDAEKERDGVDDDASDLGTRESDGPDENPKPRSTGGATSAR